MHLAILRRAGLLDTRRAGKEVDYRPNYVRMVGAAEQLLAYLKRCARCEE